MDREGVFRCAPGVRKDESEDSRTFTVGFPESREGCFVCFIIINVCPVKNSRRSCPLPYPCPDGRAVILLRRRPLFAMYQGRCFRRRILHHRPACTRLVTLRFTWRRRPTRPFDITLSFHTTARLISYSVNRPSCWTTIRVLTIKVEKFDANGTLSMFVDHEKIGLVTRERRCQRNRRIVYLFCRLSDT